MPYPCSAQSGVTSIQFYDAMTSRMPDPCSALSGVTAVQFYDAMKVFALHAALLGKQDLHDTPAYRTAQHFCIHHKATLFRNRKRIRTPYGVAGFRNLPVSLQLPNEMTEQSFAALVRTDLPEYYRNQQLNIRSLCADRYSQRVARFLAAYDVKVVQEEAFFMEVDAVFAQDHCRKTAMK
jgi:hypothetical protein